MWDRDYVRSSERLGKEGIKINHHLKRGLFEFLKYKKRNKIDYASLNHWSKKPFSENSSNRAAMSLSILACEPGQSFWLGQDIQVVVLGNSQGIVRLGIEAPSQVKISRAEEPPINN